MKRRLAVPSLLAAAFTLTAPALPAQAAASAPAVAPAAAPSGPLFADCPEPPPGADAGTWTCHSLTASDTLLRFNKMSAHTTEPLRLTVAQGKVGGQAVAKVGALRGDPVPFVTGIPGTPAQIPHPLGWKVAITPTGSIEPGAIVPHRLGLTARIVGDGLGDACTVSSTVKTDIQWLVPWVDGDGFGWRMQVYDSVYSLPTARNCGGNDLLVNQAVGLPANATSNHFQVVWMLRSADY